MDVKEKTLLEGSYREQKIKKAGKYLMVLDLSIGIVFTFIIIIFYGFQIKPFYFPLPILISFWILILFGMLVSMFFIRFFEIKINKNSTNKYVMAKNSMKKAMISIVIFAIIGVILFLPMTKEYTENMWTSNGTVNDGAYVDFYSKNYLGFYEVNEISFSGYATTVYVLDYENYSMYSNDRTVLESMLEDGYNSIAVFTSDLINNETISFNVWTLPYERYVIYAVGHAANYDMNVELDSNFVFSIPLISLFIVGVNVGWSVHLSKVKKKYVEDSIVK